MSLKLVEKVEFYQRKEGRMGRRLLKIKVPATVRRCPRSAARGKITSDVVPQWEKKGGGGSRSLTERLSKVFRLWLWLLLRSSYKEKCPFKKANSQSLAEYKDCSSQVEIPCRGTVEPRCLWVVKVTLAVKRATMHIFI